MKIVGVLCAFVFIIVTGAECAKILGVFHVAGKSHYMACSTVMKILAERGHDVTIVALFKEKNPPKNYRQIVIDGLYEKASAGQRPCTQISCGHEKIRDSGFELLEHPPYSPDLAPSDYHLFPQLKKRFKGRKFSSNEEVMKAVEVWFTEQEETCFFERSRDVAGSL